MERGATLLKKHAKDVMSGPPINIKNAKTVMTKAKGICRLCNQLAELKRSHILPAAAHRVTKDNGRNVISYLRRQVFNSQNQTDFAEPLLCFACEQNLSIFEGDAIGACRIASTHRRDLTYSIPTIKVRALAEFAYSVFWRASVSKMLDDYSLGEAIEERLKAAFVTGDFPDPPALALSISFLEVTGVTITDRILMTPWIENLAAGMRVTYFTVFGIVFRLHFPASLHELEEDEFLHVRTGTGKMYGLRSWEREGIDKMFSLAVAQARQR